MATAPAILSEITPTLATSEVLFRRIAVAIDFSVQSPTVLRTAANIARAFDAELILVNAATPGMYNTGTEPVPAEVYELNRDAARAQLAALIAAEPAFKELRYDTLVEYDDPVNLLERLASQLPIDLIIAGSHGSRGLERLALGSVAECILRHLTVPVLIVGPNARSSGSPFHSIVFASDLRLTGLRGAQYASSLAERFHGRLTMLHAIEGRPRQPQVQPELAERQIKQELTQLIPTDINTYTTANLRIEFGKAGDVVDHVARSEAATLIVAGVGQHSMLADHTPWSTLAQIIRQARCPVLCVQPRCTNQEA